MNKAESKYFNTALKMDEALIRLLERKQLEYITVKEICEEAGVNRSTFYLHYETIDDLLTECVERTNEKFGTYFEQNAADLIARIKDLPLEELIFIKPEYLYPYLNFVKENRTVFAAAINSPQGMESVQKFNSLYQFIIEPILERFDYPGDERRYAVSFFINGMIAVISEWLENGCREPVEKIADVIINCIRPCINRE